MTALEDLRTSLPTRSGSRLRHRRHAAVSRRQAAATQSPDFKAPPPGDLTIVDSAPSAKGGDSSLLCENESTRQRMLEMERTIRPARVALFLVLAATLAALGPWVGWWPFAPLAGAVVGFHLADAKMPKSARPEYWIMGAWAFSQLMIGFAIIFSGGPNSLFLPWLTIPAATLGARFNTRGVIAGALWTVAVMLAATVGAHWQAVADGPQRLLLPLSLLCGVVLLSTALMRSDLKYRAAASIDPLTGLFNRQALSVRAAELCQQATATGMSLSLLLGDLDDFKRVNDLHGHVFGDQVLCDVAEVLRQTLRTFDYIFRYGGEEFLILLPASDSEGALVAAEKLRSAVAQASMAGLKMTMSFGISVLDGDEADLDRLISAADRALYRAKSAGRNCVRLAAA
jgi:diguanylate cyclase (GGDEF)-like protein